MLSNACMALKHQMGLYLLLHRVSRGAPVTPLGPCTKVDVPHWITYLSRTPRFEWYAIWCGSKN